VHTLGGRKFAKASVFVFPAFFRGQSNRGIHDEYADGGPWAKFRFNPGLAGTGINAAATPRGGKTIHDL
jgi:hypothetical protein